MVHSFVWVVPSLMVAIGSVVAEPVQSPTRLSDAEISDAIRAGHAGKTVEHVCRVPTGGGAHYVVTLEGPLGRIMRVARVAASVDALITPDALPDYMRYHTMSVSVTGGVWEPQDLPPGSTYFPGEVAPTPPARARMPHATGITLAGGGEQIPPVYAGSRRFRPLPLELDFDLAAVARLNGDVDVHVSGSASASCRIGTRTLARLR